MFFKKKIPQQFLEMSLKIKAKFLTKNNLKTNRVQKILSKIKDYKKIRTMKNLRLRPKTKRKIYLCNLVKKEKLKILIKKGSNF
jgi:hypothetical protein